MHYQIILNTYTFSGTRVRLRIEPGIGGWVSCMMITSTPTKDKINYTYFYVRGKMYKIPSKNVETKLSLSWIMQEIHYPDYVRLADSPLPYG